MAVKKYKKPLPPCPDPALYQLIKTKEGSFWRRKRGTVNPVKLNKAFAANAKAMKIASPAAAGIVNSLYTYMKGLTSGRLNSRICAGLLKHYSKTKQLSFAPLINMDIQPQYPMAKLLLANYVHSIKGKQVELQIQSYPEGIKKQNNLVTEYFFELILLEADNKTFTTIKSNYAVSKAYSFTAKHFEGCKLTLPLPTTSINWMLLLKISCTESNEMAAHSKHYAMKVIRVA
jgi:hypothetical protein